MGAVCIYDRYCMARYRRHIVTRTKLKVNDLLCEWNCIFSPSSPPFCELADHPLLYALIVAARRMEHSWNMQVSPLSYTSTRATRWCTLSTFPRHESLFRAKVQRIEAPEWMDLNPFQSFVRAKLTTQLLQLTSAMLCASYKTSMREIHSERFFDLIHYICSIILRYICWIHFH